MHGDVALYVLAIGKVLLVTGIGPGFAAIATWELICRAEQRAKRPKAVVIPFPRRKKFPSWGGRTALADRNLLHERQASAGARPLISGR
jgi:hypothetical protein